MVSTAARCSVRYIKGSPDSRRGPQSSAPRANETRGESPPHSPSRSPETPRGACWPTSRRRSLVLPKKHGTYPASWLPAGRLRQVTTTPRGRAQRQKGALRSEGGPWPILIGSSGLLRTNSIYRSALRRGGRRPLHSSHWAPMSSKDFLW